MINNQVRPRFHLAIAVDDLGAARTFYTRVLKCASGRESSRWVDFDFHGHQLTVHLSDQPTQELAINRVDGHDIPVRHFGLILEWQDWHELKDSIVEAGVEFLVKPGIRFQGQAGEQATLFIRDPAGNGIEFKSFRDMAKVFERQGDE